MTVAGLTAEVQSSWRGLDLNYLLVNYRKPYTAHFNQLFGRKLQKHFHRLQVAENVQSELIFGQKQTYRLRHVCRMFMGNKQTNKNGLKTKMFFSVPKSFIVCPLTVTDICSMQIVKQPKGDFAPTLNTNDFKCSYLNHSEMEQEERSSFTSTEL